jgi:hypothetical protein
VDDELSSRILTSLDTLGNKREKRESSADGAAYNGAPSIAANIVKPHEYKSPATPNQGDRQTYCGSA